MKRKSLLIGSTDNRNRLIDSSRFSSYRKLLRVTAWVLRFERHARQQSRFSGELDALELTNARSYWIKEVQSDCFRAELQALQRGCPLPRESRVARFNPLLEDGLLRIGGRLQFADLPRKQMHPILLYGSHHFNSADHADTHLSAPLGSSHCAVGITGGILDITSTAGNKEGLVHVPPM